MPQLRTDDGPRKLRAVWLGPAGHTMPFQWTYVQWCVCLVSVTASVTVGALIGWLAFRSSVATFTGGLYLGAAGLWFGIKIMRAVTYDEPLRYHRRLIRREFDRSFSVPSEPTPLRVQMDSPTVGYLSLTGLRALGLETAADQRRVQAVTRNPYLN